ncbi:glycosyltransferase family 2 protein [Serratia liquefaciens]|uniref:glycosyltransferase family 2 protein n=1 Tax=Serratia liquefaciens TaxID=614 RepID=UPI000DFB2434|nr:glycosyltransferase family 2 protein [Serratia liquefaciens]RYM87477.1 glycosyl transferase [Serratia liquefaciens]CAI1725940.1 Glycosyl transferase family 2 [Serratia liquefaciens]SUI66039.1 Glycosyl transferase family 2 [Serratia liquefaciens]HDS8357224.1 glycosyltransferase family 2 protein [Serratia liquefaciens]
MTDKPSDNTAILLCTRNGENYLYDQLSSYESQTYKNWSLWVSDDGSTDTSRDIIADFISQSGIRGYLLSGPQQGFCANFMSLVANPEIQATYYAFSDQDDVWLDDKLARATQWLQSIKADIPAVYCSRTRLTDSTGAVKGFSPDHEKAPGFGNALLQNIASGNTMVFNHSARELLRKAQGAPMVVHDWSLYQIVAGCGGAVFYDRQPTVLYRQHNNNVIGNGMSPLHRLQNFIAAHGGRTAQWNDQNRQVLACVSENLTPEAKQSLATFSAIRDNSVLNRLRLMRRSGIYHQQWIGSLTTLTYVLLNKI